MYVSVAVSALRSPRIGGHLRIHGLSSLVSISAHSSAICDFVIPVE
jgi:hypothetical protein